MHIFYCPNISGNHTLLSPEESSHCIRVLRLGKGDRIRLIDGMGSLYEAIIEIPDSRQCQVEITGLVSRQSGRDYYLHVAIAPTKNMDRFEWFVEKSTEIGIDIITPILCHRSERRVLKTDRLQKLIISTMKQAMIPYMPVLNELTDFGNFIDNMAGSPYNRFIAHCDDIDRKKLKDALVPKTHALILVGPEGDFTPGEIDLAITHGFIPVTLGKNRLRTETAGLVACHTVHLINA
jgi:16S rRNA (uracil1498-N3)-methyltransferase